MARSKANNHNYSTTQATTNQNPQEDDEYLDQRTTMTSYALIHTTPAIHDPKELNTIITASLRSMFGECQAHGVGVSVLKCRPCSSKEDNCYGSYEAIIECPSQSLPYLRAALTLPSPPSYLKEILYRFDFVKIEDNCSKPTWV